MKRAHSVRPITFTLPLWVFLAWRATDYITAPRQLRIKWLRLPGDIVFIVFGAILILIAALKGWSAARKGY